MDIGSLLQEKLGSSKSEKEEHEKSESSAIDKFIDALAKNDRESAKAAFNHAVYEHMMEMEDEDEEDSDEDSEGLLIAMSPNKGVHSERSYKKPSRRGKNFTAREKSMMEPRGK